MLVIVQFGGVPCWGSIYFTSLKSPSPNGLELTVLALTSWAWYILFELKRWSRTVEHRIILKTQSSNLKKNPKNASCETTSLSPFLALLCQRMYRSPYCTASLIIQWIVAVSHLSLYTILMCVCVCVCVCVCFNGLLLTAACSKRLADSNTSKCKTRPSKK